MITFTNRKRIQFYLWLGAVWLLLWLFNSFFNHQRTFAPTALNEIWQVFYIVFVNYIFFEFSLPLIIKKRPKVLYNILIGIPLVAIHLALLSFGLYAWNRLGMKLHIYTQFRFSNLSQGGFYNYLIDAAFYEAQTGIASIFFFGVAKLYHHNIILRQTAQ